MNTSADRLTAARMLLRVEAGAFSTRLLGGDGRPGVRVRVLGVLRWQLSLDRALAGFVRRPVAELDPEVRAVLRLGLLDGAVLGVPWPVAVDGSVHLVRRLGRSSASGMVNAVLRRAAPEVERLLAEGTLAERWSHPEWLVERWLEHHGREATLAVLEADQQPADLWVWLRVPASDATSEVASLRLEPHPWCPGAYRSEGPARDLIERVSDGRAYAQDPSSQLVAQVALAAAPEATTVADLCAAPGGKAAMIARHRPEVRLVAIDRRLGRCRLVAGLLPGAVVVGDATEAPLAPRSVDLVLLDAPCSGSGTLRRHPELRWRLSPAGLVEMAAVQARLLGAARELVRPGGVLVYATCSIEPEENERLFDPMPPGFEPVDLRPLLPPGCPAGPTAAGGARILPRPEADGFTIHALRRRH